MPLLEIHHITKDFGGLRANDDISFSLEKEELVGLIGPNGAGKTPFLTVFRDCIRLLPVKFFLMVKTSPN